MGWPGDLFARVDEWADLDGFAAPTRPGLDIGIVSGRRRQGKSYLLRRLAAAHGGIYSLALEEERRPALDRFGRGVTTALNRAVLRRLDTRHPARPRPRRWGSRPAGGPR